MAMRSDPRITATKLAEYMGASFARKRSILQEQKFPQAFAMARWGDAERPISHYVAQGQTNLGIIDGQIAKLQAKVVSGDFAIQNRDLCVDALKSFKLLSNQLNIGKFTRILGLGQKGMPVPISGVEVSVLPQVLLQGVTIKGTKVCGGVKFSFPKTYPLDKNSAEYLSVLIHWHCEKYFKNMGKSDLRLCYSIDIPTSTVFVPPASYKRRRHHIEEACHEILQRWPNVPAP